MRASGGRPSSGSSLLLRAGEMNLLVEPELNRLLQGVQHVVALGEEDDDVRVGRLRLDQVG